MPLRALLCPRCSAPLPPRARLTTVVCEHCGAAVSPERARVRAADYLRALADAQAAAGTGELSVGGTGYRHLGLVAEGAHARVLLAERAARLSERVVVKALRSAGHASLLEHEWRVLGALQDSDAQGAAVFSRWVPQPVALGPLRGADGGLEGPALVLRARSGFVHTLDDVRRAHPGGLDPRHAVWVWRRLLDLLGWAHRAGWCHAAVRPEHVLVHARDHGAMLVSWSHAVPAAPSGVARDLAATAACVRHVLAGSAAPGPLDTLLRACEAGRPPDTDGWDLGARVRDAAREAFGPPRFVPLHLPGWA